MKLTQIDILDQSDELLKLEGEMVTKEKIKSARDKRPEHNFKEINRTSKILNRFQKTLNEKS